MLKIKITVMRALTYEDVFGDDVPEYFPSSTPSQCVKHKAGEVFITEGTDCPEASATGPTPTSRKRSSTSTTGEKTTG